MPIDERTPVYPGDSKPRITNMRTIAEIGYNEKKLEFNSHFSTHVDAPFHMIESGKKLTDFKMEKFIGKGIILDVSGQKEIISIDTSQIERGDIVFLYTGQTEKYLTEDFFKNNPVLSEKVAKELIDKKISIIGLDSYTPDNPPHVVHKMFLAREILIIENLVNLKPLVGKRVEFIILPLKIQDADGAPCRVIAGNFLEKRLIKNGQEKKKKP